MRVAGAHRTPPPVDGARVRVVAIGSEFYRGGTFARKVRTMRNDESESAAQVPKTICFEAHKRLEGEARVHFGSSIIEGKGTSTAKPCLNDCSTKSNKIVL